MMQINNQVRSSMVAEAAGLCIRHKVGRVSVIGIEQLMGLRGDGRTVRTVGVLVGHGGKVYV